MRRGAQAALRAKLAYRQHDARLSWFTTVLIRLFWRQPLGSPPRPRTQAQAQAQVHVHVHVHVHVQVQVQVHVQA